MLLTIPIADPERFTLKDQLVTYIGIFVELYNWRNHKQVYEIHGMIKLEKIYALITKNPRNLGTYRIIKIPSVLYSAYVVSRDQDKFVFYINNYIN